MLITERGVPERFNETDVWGGRTMARLDDGWCAAQNRDTLMCDLRAAAPDLPGVCNGQGRVCCGAARQSPNFATSLAQ